MNKAGLWLNGLLTVYGLGTVFALLPQFHDWAGWLLAAAVASNTVIHVWFPGKAPLDVVTAPADTPPPVLGQ